MTSNKKFDHKEVEEKWQTEWEEQKLYQPSLKSAENPYYNLMMFPYPSAEGLHVGNMYAFTGSDIYGRYKRMSGFDVFEPIGLDGFGIHSENYAIKVGRHPKEHAKLSQKNFYRQLRQIGNGFSWDSRLETYDPDYYKWTQWIFVQMFKAGLAYRDKATVNWCPGCKTVLADEQVEAGECERCHSTVTRRAMWSWYFGITQYADKLLADTDELKWPKKITVAQKNWIGKKEGINVTYEIDGLKDKIVCFTTRPDTNFGATFIVLAPEHKFVQKILNKDIEVDSKVYSDIKKYVDKALNKSEQQRQVEGKNKTGVNTSFIAINNLNNTKMPIYISDFVLSGVGTGAVIGVPGHDERDFEFAKAFDLDIKEVVSDKGTIINSDFLDGLSTDEAISKMMDHLEEKDWGERVYNYHLRDWLISRQRYWGPPIPMVECKKCSWQPVPEKDLPVELPDIKDFKPKGDGTSPLSNAPDSWKNTTCPKCSGPAKRELDVSDTFLDSSWYFIAYLNKQEPFNNKAVANKWLPVSAYVGGAEHAVLHLLYARFVWKFLQDQKFIDKKLGPEPFPFLYGHGLLIKDGSKMSKSKGNVINPDVYIEKYGADVLRSYLMFIGPYDQGGDFKDAGIEGMKRFQTRIWDLVNGAVSDKSDKKLNIILHRTIKKVTSDMENFRFNTALSSLMEYLNELKSGKPRKQNLEALVQMIAPFMPHMAEELWVEVLGNEFSVHKSAWPEHDEALTKEDKVIIIIQINGKMRGQIEVDVSEIESASKILKLAKSDSKVTKHLKNMKIKKEIYIKGKIVNFVI